MTETPLAPRRPSAKAEKIFESRGFSCEEQTTCVADLKLKAAILWDEIDQMKQYPNFDPSEQRRLQSLAKTSLEESVMWAVKAVSRS